MPRIKAKACAVSLLLATGSALAGPVEPQLLATNGTRAYFFERATTPEEFDTISTLDAASGYQAITRDASGRVVMHGIVGGQGVFYHLRGRDGNWRVDAIAQTEAWYNTITYVGERLFGVRNAAGRLDEVVELNPETFAEIGSFGSFELGIGGMAYVPHLDEFVVGDTYSNSFYAIGTGFTEASVAGQIRTLGHSGMRWGGHGLEYFDGQVYGAAIRGDDMSLVFGHVDLDSGHFEVSSILAGAIHGGVGFGIVPSPGTIGVLGAMGLIATRRRRGT
jgi:hypothetical protein